jgi:hypothetical protein
LAAAYDLRSRSIAAPFIRRLHILHYRDLSSFWNGTFSSLDGFDAVTSLSLQCLPWDEILPEIKLTISNRFFAIVRLELEKVVTTSFFEFAQTICTFRCLESLILGSTIWHTSNKASPLLRLPQRLHALELDGSDFSEILEWLCSFGRDLTLRNVCLLNPCDRHEQVFNTFLGVLGPSLESFRLRLGGALLLSLFEYFLYAQYRFKQESIVPCVCITMRTSVSFTSRPGAGSETKLGLLHFYRGPFLSTWKRFLSAFIIASGGIFPISPITVSLWNGATWMPYSRNGSSQTSNM